MTLTLNKVSTATFSASELALAIALVVFIMLTLFLTSVLVLLFANKNFRVFFFRENVENRPPETEQLNELDILEQEEPASKKQKRKKRSIDELGDGIPTVPLNMPIAADEQAATKPRRKKKQSDYTAIATVEIPTMESTYVTSNKTITKVKKARKKSSENS